MNRVVQDDAFPEYFAFGDISIDVAIRVPHLPQPDEKQHAETLGEFPGGMAANAASAVAALGGRAGIVSLVGEDDYGKHALEDLRRRGVDLRFVRAIPERTFWTLALLGPGGEKSLVEFPTPAVRANWEGFDWSSLQRMRFVHLIPDDREEELRLFNLARDCGVTTSLDLEASMLEYPNILDLVSRTDVLFLSAPASQHFGPDLKSASQRLTEMGVETILITLGAGGCFVKESGGNSYQIPGHSVLPLDTTGAGDCFAGAFAYGRLSGWPDRDSAELANLMAALSTTAYGSRGAILSASQLCPIAEEKGYPWWRRLK